MKSPYLDLGFVEYVSHMGTDRSIAEAAWVSTDRTQDRTDADAHRLIVYLAKNGHWTPFGQTAVTLRFRIPIFVARQLMRSNIGIVWNEESRRYVSTPPQFHVPNTWRAKSDSLKQGSGGNFTNSTNQGRLVIENSLTHETWEGTPDDALASCYRKCLDTYTAMIAAGIAPEQARIVLPLGMYTTIVGTFSLAALARVYSLRAHPHAQREIRELASSINHIMDIHALFPISWAVLTSPSSFLPTHNPTP